MGENIEVSFNFTICEVLFGIPISNTKELDITNFLLMIGKWYINQCRMDESPIYFINYLYIVRKKMEIIILNNKLNQCENAEWQDVLFEVT